MSAVAVSQNKEPEVDLVAQALAASGIDPLIAMDERTLEDMIEQQTGIFEDNQTLDVDPPLQGGLTQPGDTGTTESVTPSASQQINREFYSKEALFNAIVICEPIDII